MAFRSAAALCDTHAMTIVLIAALAYLAAAALLFRAMGQDRLQPGRGWLAAALPAVLLHAAYHLVVAWRTPGGPDMHFFSALSLVGLGMRSEEHTSELQSRENLVCRLLLEK